MNIALIDDHQILAESIGHSIKKSIPQAKVKVFDRAKAFLSQDFSQWQPDVVILDIMMPEMDGVEMFKRMKPLLTPTCKIIFLSALNDIAIIKKSIKEGANGFVSKASALEELLVAIETVQQGKQFISQSIKDDMLNYMLSGEEPIDAMLSPREREVLQKLCAGKTTKEIAFEMTLSLGTVQAYNTSILKKFKFSRTLDLVTFAIQKGIYKPLTM